MASFAQRLIDWQHCHGRRDLPWQQDRDPYRVWLSEIMLQQTQVATVIPYYLRFLTRFPALADLAAAPVEEVLALWSGLGYYARARNLHRCARSVMAEHDGRFPETSAGLAELPGIGRSTANAIAVFCFGARVPILDGNVKRLLCRHRGIDGHPGVSAVENRLWRDAEALLPARNIDIYIQAQMDLGASVCVRTRPQCTRCPVAADCVALGESRVAELPAPRPRRARPERHVTLLILRFGEKILLEERPPAGIWGGLLSLPELPAGTPAAEHCRHRFGADIDAVLPAPTLTHDFTHFRLHIHPLLCAAAIAPRVLEAGLRWMKPGELAQAALPAPIRKLLSAIP